MNPTIRNTFKAIYGRLPTEADAAIVYQMYAGEALPVSEALRVLKILWPNWPTKEGK